MKAVNFFVFFLMLLSGCSMQEERFAWSPTPFNMPPGVLDEIERLNQAGYLSNESRKAIYGLMMHNCLYAEKLDVPCQYPQLYYTPNPKAIR